MSSKLADKVAALDAEIESTREQAGTKWSDFADLRDKLAASDVDVSDENSDAFKKAHEAHEAYGRLADTVDGLRAQRDRLWKMVGESDPEAGPKGAAEVRERIKDGLHSIEVASDRIIAGEAYDLLRKSGALNSSSPLGSVQLGEAFSRDELAASLKQASVIVTDESGDNTVRPFIEPQHRGYVEPRFRPLVLLDLITVGQTDSDSIDYVVETGYTNNAAAVPEASTDAAIDGQTVTATDGGRKPQSALSFEKKAESVSTLAHWVAATKKSLGDAPRLRSIIENRLRRGLADVLEDQIVDGNGSGENLTGILNTPNVQSQARTVGEPIVNDILRALTKVRLAYFDPSAVGMNPLDYQDIRLQRDESGGAGTGGYLYGPPSQIGPTTVWGVPSVQGPQFPEGNPLVGDFAAAELYIREGVVVLATDSHEDFFTRNLVAILAEMRAGFVLPQPEAFCEVAAGSGS